MLKNKKQQKIVENFAKAMRNEVEKKKLLTRGRESKMFNKTPIPVAASVDNSNAATD